MKKICLKEKNAKKKVRVDELVKCCPNQPGRVDRLPWFERCGHGLFERSFDQIVEYRVAKNTMMRLFAADKAGGRAQMPWSDQTTVAFAGGDEVAAAKILADFERGSKVFKIKAGLLGQKLLSSADIGNLAKMPSRDVMLAQVVAGIQSPIAGLVGTLSGVIGGLVGTLEARRQQLEEQGTAA